MGHATHIHDSGPVAPCLHNNNNRRRDVFCGEEEARDGRLKREEGGKKTKWKMEMEECKGERISKHGEEGNGEGEERGKHIRGVEGRRGGRAKNRENNREQDESGEKRRRWI